MTQNLDKNHFYQESWDKISPSWPLQNIIATNPLRGFENIKFEEALKKGLKFFGNQQLPPMLERINQITIKWCMVYFDCGQATISMPNQKQGFYHAWKKLAIYDEQIHGGIKSNIEFIDNLPNDSISAINRILKNINIVKSDEQEFITAILATLGGWASYVKYLGEWKYQKNHEIENDFLAIRLAIAKIIWPNIGQEMLQFIRCNQAINLVPKLLSEIKNNEENHQSKLLEQINKNKKNLKSIAKKFDAQLVFCIDVRSEPIRRAIEKCGNYQTFGFAGFFGIPTAIIDELNNELYASCPVLLTPKHEVAKKSNCSSHIRHKQLRGYSTISEIKKFYQSLKYNFTTPLPLAEGMGIWSGGWMFIKTFSPKSKKFLLQKFRNALHQNLDSSLEINSIPFLDQCDYAKGALRAIGLVNNFSEIIILCGHGSHTENNTYATALDCGACGGRHGDNNAKILAKILNQDEVRKRLENDGIIIPKNTRFIAGKHNTTTDEIEIYCEENYEEKIIKDLKIDLVKAREINNIERARKMGLNYSKNKVADFIFKRSQNWSETQPEWGLARNASFIVAPRSLTSEINLDGRSFLHSYDWQIDKDGSILNLILNAPMIVAQWINSQYLFSTLNNVAFGSGSKITQNIVGKIGVMQGNASDLMNGLPLQSVYINDEKSYHKIARLFTFIYAPTAMVDEVIAKSSKLQQLVVNEWIKISCLDPRNEKIFKLQNNLDWL